MPHDDDKLASVSLKTAAGKQYFRIHSKDFARVVSKYCAVPLSPSFRCIVEFDPTETLFVIDPKAILDTSKPSLTQE